MTQPNGRRVDHNPKLERIVLRPHGDGSYCFHYIDENGDHVEGNVLMAEAQAWLAYTKTGELLDMYNLEYVEHTVRLIPAVKRINDPSMFLKFGGKVYLYTVHSESQEVIMEACSTGFKFCRDTYCVDAIKFYANNMKRGFYAYNN